ncbi:MAG: hypothetical protein HW406_1800 [Candidatus Brocadiaceae bacterium]|nr:hypothetical protein [Candidatus Brocadiaceae bacterium]MBM2834639.1 hypothetical protein [Candidatus Brocadiaceae bacterium]
MVIKLKTLCKTSCFLRLISFQLRLGRVRNGLSKSGIITLLCIFAAYIPAMILVQQCEYFLVNDFRPYHISCFEDWTQRLLSYFNPFAATVWLHRPVPESFEWASSLIFKGYPGIWHVVSLSFRLLTIALVWILLGCFRCSNHARIIGTLFIAFFPAFPESQLIFAETLLIPFLLITYIGVIVLYKEAGTRGARTSLAVMTSASFILMTLCKEILAPLSFTFLVFFYPVLWRRQKTLFRAFYTVMSLATLLQLERCYLTIFQPYAQGGENAGHSPMSAITNLVWIVGDSFLLRTNIAPTTILLFLFTIVGFYQLARAFTGKQPSRGVGLLCVISFVITVVIHLLTPYRALRYLYPGAVLLVPAMAYGYDALLPASTRLKSWIFKYLAIALFLFSLPGIYAQALSMQASSKADWAFLSYIVQQYSAGKDIVFVKEPDYERSIWAKSELLGVNLTGQLRTGNNGHILEVESGIDFQSINPNSIVVFTPVMNPDKNKKDLLSLKIDKTFDFTKQGTPYTVLSRIQSLTKTFNPFYRFLAEGGSTPFPGHYWQTYIPVSGVRAF